MRVAKDSWYVEDEGADEFIKLIAGFMTSRSRLMKSR